MNKIQKLYYTVLLIPLIGYSQLSDLARIDFTYVPDKNSDVEYTRIRALANYPFKLKNKGEYMLIGLDYSNIHLKFNNIELPFDKNSLYDFQILDLNIGYTKLINENWRFAIRISPGFSTNLAASDLSPDDLTLSTDLLFINKKTVKNGKDSKLIFGIRYSGNSGFPYPLPFINYYKKFRYHWSYNIGIPKTNIQYHFSVKNRLKLYAELDGFTANLQDGVLLDNIGLAESINMSLIVSGLQYEHYFSEHLQLYLRTSYILSFKNGLRDKSRNDLLIIDTVSRPYFRTGMRFKI